MNQSSDISSYVSISSDVWFIGTFNYNLGCFLCDLLPHLVSNDYFCKDAFSFVSQIKNASLSREFLVSYDLTSLFTNISVQETTNIQ